MLQYPLLLDFLWDKVFIMFKDEVVFFHVKEQWLLLSSVLKDTECFQVF